MFGWAKLFDSFIQTGYFEDIKQSSHDVREEPKCPVTCIQTHWRPEKLPASRFGLSRGTGEAERFSQRSSFCLGVEEMRWGEGAHLRKWPCTLMTRPQPVTYRNSRVFHSWGFTKSLGICLCWVRSSFNITCLSFLGFYCKKQKKFSQLYSHQSKTFSFCCFILCLDLRLLS